MTERSYSVGEGKAIRDAALKVSGKKVFVGDMSLPGMLHAKVLFSKCAHAKITRIDTSRALQLPGVRAVACHLNTPQTRFNSAKRFIEHDIPRTERIFDDRVRFVGDKVAAVAADTPAIAEAALRLIEVEYEELPVMLDIEDALAEDAYPIHEGGNALAAIQNSAGDVERAFAECDFVMEEHYTTPGIHHAAIEPHVAIADYGQDGKLSVYSSCQNTFAFRCILSEIFGLPYSKIRMVAPAIGGAFGGKLEMTLEPIAAVLSKMCRKPVKLEYTRRECMVSTRVRHPSASTLRVGYNKDGRIHAIDLKMFTNTGAYASSALNVAGALSHKVYKAYKAPNVRVTVQPVYTNTPVAGAMRGYGSPQAFFPLERQMNKIANHLGMDNAELHRLNMVEPDSLDPATHKPHGNPRPQDCLSKALTLIDYPAALREQAESKARRWKVGVGLALGVHGNNCFGAHRDTTSLMIKMNEDGSCILYTGSHDMGTDTVGMQVQILTQELGISTGKIDVVQADTDTCLWHLGDYASRGTYMAGGAALRTAQLLKRELQTEAAKLLGVPPDDIALENDEAYSLAQPEKRASLTEVMTFCQRESQREICVSCTHTADRGASSYGVHIAKVLVDSETGAVRVTDYAAVQDVGFKINPAALEGQLAGAIHMGLGYALCEEMQYSPEGKPLATNLKKYHVLRASEMPQLRLDFVAEGEPGGPYGAKSLGECPVVPVAPAVLNAICNALGCELNHLPARPARVLEAMQSRA